MPNIIKLEVMEFDSTLLHEELEEALTAKRFSGLNSGPFGIHVHVADDVTEEEVRAVSDIHDPEVKKSKVRIREEDRMNKAAWLLDLDFQAIRDDLAASDLEAASEKLIQVTEALTTLLVR